MKEIIAYWEEELGIFDLGYRQSYAVKVVCCALIILIGVYRFAITVLLPIWILPYMIYKAMRWGEE